MDHVSGLDMLLRFADTNNSIDFYKCGKILRKLENCHFGVRNKGVGVRA